jgi:hypothetical protein
MVIHLYDVLVAASVERDVDHLGAHALVATGCVE